MEFVWRHGQQGDMGYREYDWVDSQQVTDMMNSMISPAGRSQFPEFTWEHLNDTASMMLRRDNTPISEVRDMQKDKAALGRRQLEGASSSTAET